MAFKDLQIQILEDVVDTCFQVVLLPSDAFFTFVPGDSGRWMKRNRPDDLVEDVREILTAKPNGPWQPRELTAALGWKHDTGAARSVGGVMSLLGWSKHRRSDKKHVVYVK